MASALAKTVGSLGALLLLIFTLPPVLAQSNAQGLRWGVEAGDVFEYDWTAQGNVTKWNVSGSWSERIRIELESLPMIPVNVYSSEDIALSPAISVSLQNGTPVTSRLPWRPIPIGNWPLVSLLLPQSMPWPIEYPAVATINASLTPTTCRVDYEWYETGPSRANHTVRVEYLLLDGVLSSFYYETAPEDSYGGEGDPDNMELVRVTPSDPRVPLTVALLAVVVALVLAAEVRRRHMVTARLTRPTRSALE